MMLFRLLCYFSLLTYLVVTMVESAMVGNYSKLGFVCIIGAWLTSSTNLIFNKLKN